MDVGLIHIYSSQVNEKLEVLIQEDAKLFLLFCRKTFQYKHPCENPRRRHHASAQIKKASTYLFPLIERDFSEHRVLSWKASGLVLGIERCWQPRVMLLAVDSESAQPHVSCAAESGCLCCQCRLHSAREILRLCTFIPDSGLFFGTTMHTGISSLSQLEWWITSDVECSW